MLITQLLDKFCTTGADDVWQISFMREIEMMVSQLDYI